MEGTRALSGRIGSRSADLGKEITIAKREITISVWRHPGAVFVSAAVAICSRIPENWWNFKRRCGSKSRCRSVPAGESFKTSGRGSRASYVWPGREGLGPACLTIGQKPCSLVQLVQLDRVTGSRDRPERKEKARTMAGRSF